MRRPTAPALLALLAIAAPLAAQHDHGPTPTIKNGGVFPPGWSVQMDMGSRPTDVSLETMAPGWHVTTAGSGIMYRAADQAAGSYTVSAKIHLFPSAGGHQEAFGLFVGGRDLDQGTQRYTYFLIRGDGTYKVKRRAGATAPDVTSGWTASPAIVQAKADGPVANTLSIKRTKDKVAFSVNGQEVWSGPAAGLDLDGIAGLRVNHNLSVHVESLVVGK